MNDMDTVSSSSAAQPRVLVFIPAYRCEAQIGRVLNQLKGEVRDWVSSVLIVDNQSPDGTIAAARTAAQELSMPWAIWRNDDNYGLGGSHKVAMQYAAANDFDYLVVLHGDDQAKLHDLHPFAADGRAFKSDCFLGARFAPGAELEGYSLLRTVGNRIYNLLFSVVCKKRIYDLGSGLNVYRIAATDFDAIKLLPDDLTFNYGMLMLSIYENRVVNFFPIAWSEQDQTSNVRLLRQAARVLYMLVWRAWKPRSFFKNDKRQVPYIDYTGKIVHSSDGR